MSSIFSSDEVRDCIRSFHSKKVLDDSKSLRPDSAEPILIPCVSGQGYVVSSYLVPKINEALNGDSEQLRISPLAEELDVKLDVVSGFLKQSPGVVFSRDRQNCLTNNQKGRVVGKLKDQASKALVSANAFSAENDVSPESLETLIGEIKSEGSLPIHRFSQKSQTAEPKASASVSRDFFYSSQYAEGLKAKLRGLIEAAHHEQDRANIVLENLPGRPPLSFVSFSVQDILQTANTELKGNVKEGESGLTFIPQTYMARKQNKQLECLKGGDILFCDINWFLTELGHLYSSREEVEKMVDGVEECKVVADYVVSKTAVEDILRKQFQGLKTAGYAAISSSLSFLPEKLRRPLSIELTTRIQMLSAGGAKTFLADNFRSIILIEDRLLDDLLSGVKSAAQDQASAQWERLMQSPETECSVEIAALIQTVVAEKSSQGHDLSPELLNPLKSTLITPTARSVFSERITALSTQNEAAFASFWVERVGVREHLYSMGLSGITDEKLRTQLQELLQSHLCTELVPEALAKAQSRGLLRSKKARKNSEKLKIILSNASSLEQVQNALATFANKQGINQEQGTKQCKDTHLSELVRSMQKQKDPARLFLTLVIVLLARYQEGVVYATGKFAPKLMKLLKDRIDDETYEKLEAWKEGVKKGSLTADDREELRNLAWGED